MQIVGGDVSEAGINQGQIVFQFVNSDAQGMSTFIASVEKIIRVTDAQAVFWKGRMLGHPFPQRIFSQNPDSIGNVLSLALLGITSVSQLPMKKTPD